MCMCVCVCVCVCVRVYERERERMKHLTCHVFNTILIFNSTAGHVGSFFYTTHDSVVISNRKPIFYCMV